MPGNLFDLIQSAMGRPDPSMQIAAALGQGPGQPGSPQGPQPLTGAPPPVGPPAGPGGAPAGAAPPPQPMATQTPPDLGSMFVQLMQRQQANEGFNRGLGMLAAGFAQPRDRATMIDAMSGQGGGDPGTLMGRIMQLQQYNQAQARYVDLVKNSDQWAKSLNMDPGVFKTLVTAAGPQGAGDAIAKIAEANAGVSGDPTIQEMNRAKGVYMAQHGITNPNDPNIPDMYKYPEQYKAGVQTEAGKAKEVVATQTNFQPAVQTYDEQIQHVNNLLANPKGYAEIAGLKGAITPTTALTPDGQRAWQDYKTIMAGQFGSAVQDFPGSRISTKELVADAPSKSTMGLMQSPDDLTKATEEYRDQLLTHRANLFGKAQQLNSPDLTDAEYDKYVSQIYKSGGDLGPKTPVGRAPPATIGSLADAASLPAGRAFVLPGSSGKIAYAVKSPADVARLPKGAPFVIPDGSGQIGYAP